jgi:hypothetical protein
MLLLLFNLIYQMTLQHAGSSIKAARLSSRHILALESDSKLFDEVLKPLKELVIVPTNSNVNDDDMELDSDSSPLIDKPFNDLCE